MQAVKFIILRTSPDETTLALVEAQINNPKLSSESHFLKALSQALTEWVENTEIGKTAWENSSQDFNIGDLSAYQYQPKLREYVATQGITGLAIDVHSANDSRCRDWTYDTVLINL